MRLARRSFLHEKQEVTQERGFLVRFGYAVGKLLFLILCGASTAFLLVVSYPQFSHSLVAWLALSPFILALLHLHGFWKTALYSWLTGIVAYAGLFYWVFITCFYGGGLSQGLSLAAWLGLSGLMALQFAIFGGSCYYLQRLGGFFPLVAAMGWVALEWAHEMLATYAVGFPWFSLAYSQWNLPQVLQVASVTGAAGVSFLVAFTGISIGYGLATVSLKNSTKHMLLAACVFLLVYGAGSWYLKYTNRPSLLRMPVAVMQPNIDQYKKWSSEFETEIHHTLQQMVNTQEGKGNLLVVWPESVTPGPVEEEPYAGWLVEMAQKSGAWQLVGTNREEQGQQYVSAFLINPQGEIAGIYDKEHLVPFGEMIPFEHLLRRLFPQVQVLGELGGFSKARAAQTPLSLGQIVFGSAICYESVFSSLWRKQAREGARFFVNITNDAWFFDTAAPYQHLAVSVLRAVENRRPVLRAANTGISAVISSSGKILSRAALNKRAILQAEVNLPLLSEVSFYGHWGNWFAWLCALVYCTVFISSVVFIYE